MRTVSRCERCGKVSAESTPTLSPRAMLATLLVAVWGLRLATHITLRNWGHGEDRRYAAIRTRNEPRFALKSLYLVFGLQAVLSWIVSLPLLAAAVSVRPFGPLDALGSAMWVVGFVSEAGGDWQLGRFKADPQNECRSFSCASQA